jgi:ABC-type transport system involved in cytochrome c biogenesis permease component
MSENNLTVSAYNNLAIAIELLTAGGVLWQNLFVPLFIPVVVRTVNIFPRAQLPKNID